MRCLNGDWSFTFVSSIPRIICRCWTILHAGKENTTEDYLVAGRGVHPALAALSAVSTWNSGFMFVGIIGFTWKMGYSVFWTAFASLLVRLLHGFGFTNLFKKKQANEGLDHFPRWFHPQQTHLKQDLQPLFRLYSCPFMQRHNSLRRKSSRANA